eukprot:TRINITY_DN22424_c0_g1_i1.p1 TRINITY_DN22424_c0_g1~~TRINITY_DN22424_c0_g1_i1.p1  ORF type:complete len:107 (+),score=7.72 TRINITY_DN22424_c0_g1_i1:155-475(+)
MDDLGTFHLPVLVSWYVSYFDNGSDYGECEVEKGVSCLRPQLFLFFAKQVVNILGSVYLSTVLSQFLVRAHGVVTDLPKNLVTMKNNREGPSYHLEDLSSLRTNTN